VILRFLGEENFSLYLAAFRLPDLVFEVFAFGAFSSAFIPVFSKYLKKDKKMAWEIAARIINIGLLIFLIISLFFTQIKPRGIKAL
jgi:putative peptidoglycan lipid II flippase